MIFIYLYVHNFYHVQVTCCYQTISKHLDIWSAASIFKSPRPSPLSDQSPVPGPDVSLSRARHVPRA